MDASNYSTLALALEQGTTSLYPQSGFAAFMVLLIIISALFVLLRCWARYVSAVQSFGLDDYFAIAAWPFSLTTQAVILHLLSYGVGKHINELEISDLDYIFYTFYWGQLVWIIGNTCIEFSALAFYARIFHPRTNPSFAWRIFYYVVIGLTIAWTVFWVLYDGVFQCRPISAFWDITRASQDCENVYTVFLIGSIGKLIIEVLILLLPLPQVLTLNVPLRKKIEVSIFFVLGYSVAFMSMGRIIVSVQLGNAINADPTFFLIPYLYWDMAEIALSIVAICLPAIFQLSRRGQRTGFRSIFRKKSRFVHSNNTPRQYRNTPGLLSSRKTGESSRDNLYDGNAFTTTVSSGPAPPVRPFKATGNLPSAISVRHDIQLEHMDMER